MQHVHNQIENNSKASHQSKLEVKQIMSTSSGINNLIPKQQPSM